MGRVELSISELADAVVLLGGRVERCLKKWCGNFFYKPVLARAHTHAKNSKIKIFVEDLNIVRYVNLVTRIETRHPIRRRFKNI